MRYDRAVTSLNYLMVREASQGKTHIKHSKTTFDSSSIGLQQYENFTVEYPSQILRFHGIMIGITQLLQILSVTMILNGIKTEGCYSLSLA